MSADSVETVLAEIRRASKYRDFPIGDDVIRDVITQEMRHTRGKELVKAVKKKLHNIVAPYLGDPDYPQAERDFQAAQTDEAVRDLCLSMARVHTSTRERLDVRDTFYPHLWGIIGQPHTLHDLACAFNPFLFPWMGLPTSTRYHAYDIHQPRVSLINRAFERLGLAPLAEVRDILLNPPTEPAYCALILKEVHRFEQRQKGISRTLINALNARWVIVSLPSQSMTGRSTLDESYRNLFYNLMRGLEYPVTETNAGDEMLFCIRKAE